jgi:hypothetical protein
MQGTPYFGNMEGSCADQRLTGGLILNMPAEGDPKKSAKPAQ